MKRFVAVQVILLFSAAACGTPTDFEAGLDAYERSDYAAAYGEFLPLAERGYAPAQNNLGFMYSKGCGVPQSDVQAAAWYRKAAEQGYAKAQFNLGFMYRYGRGVPQSDAQAVAWYHKAAEQGDSKAQFFLGVMPGVPGRGALPVEWLRKAAEQGEVLAQVQLGLRYSYSYRDYTEAAAWYRKAAEQGNVFAQYTLGEVYHEAQNYAQAAAWYRKAAEQDGAVERVRAYDQVGGLAPLAQSRLAFMYLNGRGVPQDDVRGYAWLYLGMRGTGDFQIAASLRESMTAAQVAEGHAQVVEWLRKAAEQGNAFSQYRLGSMYAIGRFVPQSDAQAVAWYRKAAAQGLAYAARSLGKMYAEGRGVSQDDVRAYAWLDIAAVAADELAAEARNSLRKSMTDAQVAEAQRLGIDLVCRIEQGAEDQGR